MAEFVDADRWRWLLTDPAGDFLADHPVALERADPEYVAFADLAGFLRREAVPDRRLTSETELVARVGGWIGRQVLGEQLGRALVEASPCVVRVVLPLDADFLLYRPLELAHAGLEREEPRPLAVQDVSLVFEVEGETPSWPSNRWMRSCGCWRCSACPQRAPPWRCGASATSWSNSSDMSPAGCGGPSSCTFCSTG